MGHGIGANRGALPCHLLASNPGAVRVLVPLEPTESLWIGWMLEADATVTGRTARDDEVCLTEVAKSADWTLMAADSIAAKEGHLPIDASSCVPVSDPDGLDRDHLIFAAGDTETSKPDRVGVVLATGALYAAVSGLPPPSPTSLSQAYGGWRLP